MKELKEKSPKKQLTIDGGTLEEPVNNIFDLYPTDERKVLKTINQLRLRNSLDVRPSSICAEPL